MSSSGCYPEKSPQINRLLDTLADNIRRELIYYFENFTSDETASLDAVATHIERRVPSKNQSELRYSLHHSHLPKLEENGWIDYDNRTNDIRYHGHEQVVPLLGDLIDVFDT